MNPILARFANEPVLLAPGTEGKFQALVEALAAHPDMEALQAEERADTDPSFWGEPGSYKSRLRPYIVDQNGVLQIPVRGVLLHDFPYAYYDLATGYEYIDAAFDRGMSDPMVKGVMLVIDSCGGMVAGCFDLVDDIYSRRGEKPIAACAAESAYSAAYALFSVADNGQAIVARTGGVGSIGVVTSHVDYSGMLDKAGVKITFIYAGDHKVDGNAYQALPADVKERIQQRIDSIYSIFVASVARNRGLEEQAVRDTQALCFTADEAISNGLADKIGRLDDALVAFAADLSNPQGDEEMSQQSGSSAEGNQAAIDTAVAAATANHATELATARTEAAAEAATAERTRVAAILGSDEATGRGALANHLALETDTAADAAVAILAKSPKVEAGAETPFNQTMNSGEHPNVGGGDGGSEAEANDPIALARAAGVRGIRPAAV